jgi:hypothetical protein
MPAREETYEGQKIKIEEQEEGEARLFIDDQEVNIIRNADDTYSSEDLYYAKYRSLRQLARAQIDKRPKE